MDLIFATNNSHKIVEVQALVGNHFTLISLQAAGIDIEIPEPFDTLEENAAEKSRIIFEQTGLSCFSEDTGLMVDCLDGAPGVKTARYAGDHATAAENISKLLQALGSRTDRSARFITVISLLLGDEAMFFKGVCEGRIGADASGTGGFGYDPIFIPNGATTSFAGMDMTEKNRYSHRRKAVDQLVLYLQTRPDMA